MGKKPLVACNVLDGLKANQGKKNPSELAREAVEKALFDGKEGWAYTGPQYKDGVINEVKRLSAADNPVYYRMDFAKNGGVSVILIATLVAEEAARLAEEVFTKGGLILNKPEPNDFIGINRRQWVVLVQSILARIKAATGGEILYRWNNWYDPGQPGLIVTKVIKVAA